MKEQIVMLKMLVVMNKSIVKFILFVSILFIYQTSKGQDLSGVWRYSNKYINVEIELKQIDSQITGTHCIVYGTLGDYVDCSEANEISIEGKLNKNTAIVSIKSYYSGYSGKIELIKDSDNKLKWVLVESPKDVFFYPKEIILTKDLNDFQKPHESSEDQH